MGFGFGPTIAEDCYGRLTELLNSHEFFQCDGSRERRCDELFLNCDETVRAPGTRQLPTPSDVDCNLNLTVWSPERNKPRIPSPISQFSLRHQSVRSTDS